MDERNVLWIINSWLLVILGFFIRSWHSSLKCELRAMVAALEKKVDYEDCKATQDRVNRSLHKHASKGEAGEVIPS